MTTSDAVIGCDAIDASTEWLRLRTTSGMVRNIPWSTIKFAGLGGNFEDRLTIGQVTEKTAPFYSTHDSLWICYGESRFVQAMIEKPEDVNRDAILARFALQLQDRWRGDRLTAGDISAELGRDIAAGVVSGMKRSLLIFAGVTLAFIALLVWSAYKK
jgi:hypothetical protein